MNNNLDSAVSKEKPIHLFTMILIFAGVCSGYYLWIVSNSTSTDKNTSEAYHGNEYVLEEGDAREAILENNIIGENGVVTARFVGNFFSSRGKLIAPYDSRIYGSFQYQKKNGFSYYFLSFDRIVSPCGLWINLKPNNKVTLSGIVSINNTKVGQKISISSLKKIDFKNTPNENINVECDYSAMQKYLND